MAKLLWVTLLSLFMAAGQASEPKEGRQLVETVSNQILEAIVENRALYKASRQSLYNLVSDVVLPHFDFEKMSKFVMARYWRKMSPEQRSRFEQEFRGLMVRIYSTALLEYSDEKIKYLPLRVNKGRDRIIVRTKIAPPGGGTALGMDYHLYLNVDSWKIFDVRVNGVSLLKSYKDRFGRQAKEDGIDAVINNLTARNEKAVSSQEATTDEPS
jgi:phospholipid transport system substrate-binding protein